MKTLSIILPIHNGAATLRHNVEFLVELLPQLTCAFQIIIVDDGSNDGSDDIAAELDRRFPQVTAIFSAKRQGEKMAIESGKKIALFKRKFILATNKIEESKIRTFISQSPVNHVDPEPRGGRNNVSVHNLAPTFPAISDPATPDPTLPDQAPRESTEKVRPSSAVGSSASSHDSDFSNPNSFQPLVGQDQVEQHLVERLMKWGIALREYRKKLGPQTPSHADLPVNFGHEAGIPGGEVDPEPADEMCVPRTEKRTEERAMVESPKKSLVPPGSWDRQQTESDKPLLPNDSRVIRIENAVADEIVQTDADRQSEAAILEQQAFFRSISIPEQRLVRMSYHDLKRMASPLGNRTKSKGSKSKTGRSV